MPISPNIYMFLTSLLNMSHFWHLYCVKFKTVKLVELVPSYRQLFLFMRAGILFGT